ncbi:ABC transporter substrate-binding protein [Rhizobium sp. Root1220]|uniref:ABC transporter substrate-binding protein n=1 Tax=Rhizobium sp. Root1220 TaxID=1736432 RepID=UPI0006F8F28B|nr:ABC transporter substrate-binding protein [Rhizobium sp. Root1220]KQV73261.1 hemin ABC transporter substrate-binding protein [Rhizobium sp. Root1220]
MYTKLLGAAARLAVIALLALVFSGLRVNASEELPALRIPISTDIGTFDPDNGFEIDGISVINNVYEGLVEYEELSTTLRGLLAESWTISDDGLLYTFKLRPGVTFQDGSPFDASAVITSFSRRRDGRFSLSYFFDNVADMKALDDRTVVLRLKEPQPSFLDSLASPWGPKILSPRALKENDGGDRASTWLNQHAVGTGPYRLSEFKRGERYGLLRNDDYWGKKPFFREVRLPVIPDVSQQMLQLRAGQIDAVPKNYPFEQLNSLPAGLIATASPNMTLYDLFLKPGTPLDEPEVRRAFMTAINPSAWVSDAFGKYATVAQSLYPKSVLTPRKPMTFPTDLDAARETIKKHGDVNVVIGLFSATSTYRRIADLLTAQLATVGINATSYVLAPGAGFAVKNDPNAPDVLLTIAGPDAAHPENQLTAFYTENAPLNFFGRRVPEADAIVDKARRMTETEERNPLYEEAGDLYLAAGVSIPLVDVDNVIVHRSDLRNFGLRPVYPIGNIDYSKVERTGP